MTVTQNVPKAKLLVTGCTGLLGSNICYNLRDSFEITGISRGPFFMNGIEHIRADFSNGEEMHELFSASKYDAVIHCAAITNVDACEKDPHQAFEINTEAAYALSRQAQSQDARFVFISTDAVFAGESEVPYKETDPVDPISIYGQTKVKAEEKILENRNSLVVRTNMYGFNWLDKESLSEWVIRSIQQGDNIKMFYDVVFNPLLANTLATSIARALHLEARGILNIGCTTPLSKYDFGREIAMRMGRPCKIQPISVDDFGFAAKRAHYMHLNCDKAQKLGISLPSIYDDIDEMLELLTLGYDRKIRG